MPAALLSARALALRAARHAQRAGAVAAAGTSAVAQSRELHASSALQARRKARGSAVARSPPTSAVFDGPPSALARDEDDEEEDFEQWAGKMQVRSAARKRDADKESVQNLVPIEIEGEDDEDLEQDEETQEFLSHVDELFSLAPNEFEKRMRTSEKREAAARRPAKRRGEASDDYDEDEDDESDRVKERISKKKLLKALDELSPTKSKKNLEGMPMVRTAAKTKMAAPLEKTTKNNAEKASYRQARVELTVVDFVQNLLLEQSDTTGIDVIPSFVEASVSPDLRRIILFWEPVRLNSDNQVISKRKVAGIETRLGKQERWVRAQVTRYLNLKYSPIIEFKQRKAHKSDEARALFDSEMQWLDRFK